MASMNEDPHTAHQDSGSVDLYQASIGVYDSLAEQYDSLFEAPGHRNIYDQLAWEFVSEFVAAARRTIIDVGCGTGRWAIKWLAAGHRVIGIEQSPRMIEVLRSKVLGPEFELLPIGMEAAIVEPASADLVVAMGSAQYAPDLGAMIEKFANWVKPGGAVCVCVDSFVALVLELLRLGKLEEAFQRLESGWGIWEQNGHPARVHLYDRRTLETLFAKAGLVEVSSHGLLVSASAWGRERYSAAIDKDPQAFLELERRLSGFASLTDTGKHILVTARRPV